jgi:hypothetical protein
MVAIVKWLAIILLSATAAVSSEEKPRDEVKYCVRWAWTGDIYNRQVRCVEWATRDCSNRLYKELCRIGR